MNGPDKEYRDQTEAQRRAEEQFRKLVEQALVGIYIFQDGFLPYVNPKAAEIVGYTQTELSSIPLSELIAEDDHALVTETIRKLMEEEARDAHIFIRGKRKDGAVIDLETQGVKTEFNGRPAVMGTFLDVTERKRMEAEVRKVQKLESLSAFASGIALEYNNILTAIIGNLALAKMYAKPGFEVFDVITEAEKASVRAKDLTSQLLSFAKGGSLIKKIVFLQELIKDLISISIDSNTVTCEVDLPASIWPVDADESQIGQAINTLLIRARQATPPGGTIRVSATNMPDGSPAALPLRGGKYVVLAIEDRGKVIPEQELQTIFDPFHAGEKKGETLGLATSFAIVKKHDGHITADSRPGAGTTFRVYLPASADKTPAAAGAVKTAPMRRGKILVMDDEEIVRVVVSRLLQQCGFEAELAKDGAEMLKLFREAKESDRPFAAVILDLIIQGGMGGQEAIKHLLAYDPGVKAIVSSGYSHDPIMSNFREYGFTGFLPKPYKLEQLRRVLAEVVTAGR